MSKLEEVQQEIAQREFTDTTIDVLSGVSRSYKVSFRLNNFHTSHTQLLRQYPIQFDPSSKSYKGNLWVVLDLLIPKMNIPKRNVYVARDVKQTKERVENEVLVGTRLPTKDLYSHPPLTGKHPHENFQIDTLKNSIAKGYYGILLKQGTGKSYIIASALRYLLKQGKIKKALICTPSTGLVDIKRKMIQFAGDAFVENDFAIITKNNRNCFDEEMREKKVLIMTYNTLRLVKDHYDKDFKKAFRVWTGAAKDLYPVQAALVCDEGHKIANSTSQRAQAAHELASIVHHRYISTGTPADKPDKYYSILKFIHPFFVRYLSKTDWTKSVANLGTNFSEFEVSEFRPEDLRYFLESASSHYTNLQDTDCLDLPPHYQKMVPVELAEGLQRDLYEKFSNLQLEVLKQEQGVLHPRQVFNKFPYLLISLDNPTILAQHEATWFESTHDIDGYQKMSNDISKLLNRFKFAKHHQKIDYTKELLDTHVVERGEKVVVWTGHPETADRLAEVLKSYNNKVEPLVIHGRSKEKGISNDELKDKVVQTFINDPRHRIMIASFLVLDTALDITAATAQIYFDLPYQLTNFDQSYKRLHRAGQDREVNTYFLVFANTLDEARYNIVFNKKTLDVNGLDSSMPLEEWKKLFSGDIPQSLDASIEEGKTLF